MNNSIFAGERYKPIMERLTETVKKHAYPLKGKQLTPAEVRSMMFDIQGDLASITGVPDRFLPEFKYNHETRAVSISKEGLQQFLDMALTFQTLRDAHE